MMKYVPFFFSLFSFPFFLFSSFFFNFSFPLFSPFFSGKSINRRRKTQDKNQHISLFFNISKKMNLSIFWNLLKFLETEKGREWKWGFSTESKNGDAKWLHDWFHTVKPRSNEPASNETLSTTDTDTLSLQPVLFYFLYWLSTDCVENSGTRFLSRFAIPQ